MASKSRDLRWHRMVGPGWGRLSKEPTHGQEVRPGALSADRRVRLPARYNITDVRGGLRLVSSKLKAEKEKGTMQSTHSVCHTEKAASSITGVSEQ